MLTYVEILAGPHGEDYQMWSSNSSSWGGGAPLSLNTCLKPHHITDSGLVENGGLIFQSSIK